MRQRYFILSLLILGTIALLLLLQIINKTSQHTLSGPQSYHTSQSTLANPASINCKNKGGTTIIKQNGAGGEYGLCEFEDNMACEEWALFRGECPVGGRKTTGYDSIEEMYCIWIGGETLAVQNALCTLPSGKTCSVDAVYNGTCN